MSSKDKFFKYIYSSSPLAGEDFASLKHDGIFKNYFADNSFRKPILEKLQKSLAASQGGVFLISGYRGIGKTTFLNYILNNLKDTHFKAQLNLSEIKFDFKLELIGWMIAIVKKAFEEELDKQLKQLLPGKFRYWYNYPFIRGYLKIYWKCKAAVARKDVEYSNCNIINLIRLTDECKDLFELVFFEQEISHGINADWQRKGLWSAGWNYKKTIKQKENLFFYEYQLKELLKKIKEYKSFSKRFVFVLDELDKLPFSSMKANRKNEGGVNAQGGKKNKYSSEIDRKYQKMEWLLKMLSDIKSFLFESGAVFVLVVNKDVYDCWKYRHSQEDLFMNLVTNVEYLPNYTKEEMELSLDFPLSLSEDVDISYPFSSHEIKKYFQTTMYYESYGNPRLYFQNLSKKLKNEEIRISRDEARYLLTKFKLFELNELVYNYVYTDNEQIFGKFLFGIDEIRGVFKRINEKIDEVEEKNGRSCDPRVDQNKNSRLKKMFGFNNEDVASLFVSYYLCLEDNRYNLREFWQNDIDKTHEKQYQESESVHENSIYNKFEAFLTILKQHDGQENYPYTNYIIRRLTDFLRIIEEKHFISIEDIYKELNLQEFEKTDTVGRYFINLLIPLAIVILRNNGVLKISGNYLHYTYDYNSSVHYYHEGCEAELNGDFNEAFNNYNRFLKAKPFHIDAHHRKLRLLYYMMKLGYYDEKIDVVSQWFDSLLKMKKCFPEENDPTLSDNWHWANYLFSVRYFLTKIAGGDQVKKYYQKLLEQNREPDSDTIEAIYTRAVERNPMNANVKMWKGYFLMHEGRYTAALDLFRDARRIYNEPLSLIREAYTYSCLQDEEKALKLYLEAFCLTTSWLQKAAVIIHLSKLENPNISIEKKDVFWQGLKDFIGDLEMKLRSKDFRNYYFIFEALCTLCESNHDKVSVEKMDCVKNMLAKQNPENSDWHNVIEFYRNKTL